ncbi:MAG: hypothetical protein E7635_06930, partial [Ruminococcaceae bacterium]|nr:hypothetical protein [Oscillospiraceae bacterium]
MQNKNETNENVSRVVADFFKKNPIKHNNHSKKNSGFLRSEHKKSADEYVDKHEAYTSNNITDQKGDYEIKDKNLHNKNNKFKKNHNKHQKKNDHQDELKLNHTYADSDTNIDPKIFNDYTAQAAEEIKEPIKNQSSDTENEWYDPNTPVEIVGVRFKNGGKIYYFAPLGNTYLKNDNVIVETARGLEFGTVHTPNSVVKIKDVVMPLKNVIRLATEEDINHYEQNCEKVKDAVRICNERILVHNLDMKLVEVEYTFDNSKLLFYFTSEGRVDFRELVKDLAGIFKTRIELRQIGIREETKLLGGIGICGRPFCCKTFLNDFAQVSIKMAKEQGLSLNSAKISGACGRLMCCLKYEHETYDEEIRKTPKTDTPVITPDGPGIVCETQPLAGLC